MPVTGLYARPLSPLQRGIEPRTDQNFQRLKDGLDVVTGQLNSGSPFVYNVMGFGARADGAHDDGPAILAAIAAIPAQGGTLYFPPGVYGLTTGITINARTDLTFQGAGANAVRLTMLASGANLLNFTGICSRVSIRDLWLGTTVKYAAGTALGVVGTSGTHSDSFLLERLVIQNAPIPCYLEYLDNSVMRDVHFSQTIAGAVASVVLRMDNDISCLFENVNAYISATPGTVPDDVVRIDHDCDTLIFVDCQAAGGTNYGFRCEKSAGSTGPRLTRFFGCTSESNGLDGYTASAARDIRFIGCESAVNSRNGYSITGAAGTCDSVVIADSLALQNGQHGIDVTGGDGVWVVGNTCSNNSQATSATYDGIHLDTPGTTDARICQNRSGDFIFTVTNKQSYGINVASGTISAATVTDNQLQGNATGGFADIGTNTYKRGNRGTTDPMQGQVALSAANPAANVSTAEVLTGDSIVLTRLAAGGTLGHLSIGAIVAGTSFTIVATGNLDTSTVAWEIVH